MYRSYTEESMEMLVKQVALCNTDQYGMGKTTVIGGGKTKELKTCIAKTYNLASHFGKGRVSLMIWLF